jgi:hypothetical protein
VKGDEIPLGKLSSAHEDPQPMSLRLSSSFIFEPAGAGASAEREMKNLLTIY